MGFVNCTYFANIFGVYHVRRSPSQHNRLDSNVATMGSVCVQLRNQPNICELDGNSSVRDVLLLRYI